MFQAIFNCFDQTLMDVAENRASDLTLCSRGMLPTVAVRFFSGLLEPVLMSMPKQFCETEWSKISQFFREAFSLPQVAYKRNGKCDLADVDEVESAIVVAFQKFVIKLNED